MRSLILLATCAAVGAFGAQAQAQPKETIQLEYEADASCPTREAFQRDVLGRTERATFTESTTSARVFRVELQRAAGRATGRLLIREPDGATFARTVNGRECSSVARVLALATALAIDPRAQLAEPEGGSSEPEGSATPALDTAPAPAVKPAPAAPPAAPTRNAQENPGEVLWTAPPDLSPPPAPAVSGTRYANAGGAVAVGITPSPVFGANLAFGGRFASAPRFVAELNATWLEGAPTSTQGAEARFRFVVARPQLCAGFIHRVGFTGALCAAVELGGLWAGGSRIPEPESHTRLWAAAHVALRGDAMLSDPLFLSLNPMATIPITRYRFTFEGPETEIHETPLLAFSAVIALGLRL